VKFEKGLPSAWGMGVYFCGTGIALLAAVLKHLRWTLTALLIVAVEGRAAAQEPAEAPPDEWLGLEGAPGWLNFFHETGARPGTWNPDPSRFTFGLSGTLRLLRRQFGHGYWTPLQLGYGQGGASSGMAHVTTEFGLAFRAGKRRVEVGAAIGAGIVAVKYGTQCDGACVGGGEPIVVSPVVRVALRPDGPFPVGAFVRAMIPTATPSNLEGNFVAFDAPVLLGIDVAYVGR
jgi:hypothetical protein